MKKMLCGFLVLATLNGCVIGYTKYPRQNLNAPPLERANGTLCYKIDGGTLAAGKLGLRDEIQNHSPFQSAEERAEPPKQGIYVAVRIENLPMSVPTLVFGYVSAALLTLTPVWSTKDGSIVHFTLYKDGEVKKAFSYEARRVGAVWLFLLPFAWVNFITPSEEKIFHMIARQFFKDARLLLE